jgi:CTP synthase
MSFVEAFRQFQFRVKRENFCLVHVSLVPQVCIKRNSLYIFYFSISLQPNSSQEHKTKPTQHSVKELRGYGLSPDLVSKHLFLLLIRKKHKSFI